jgi:hypothetical protein
MREAWNKQRISKTGGAAELTDERTGTAHDVSRYVVFRTFVKGKIPIKEEKMGRRAVIWSAAGKRGRL